MENLSLTLTFFTSQLAVCPAGRARLSRSHRHRDHPTTKRTNRELKPAATKKRSIQESVPRKSKILRKKTMSGRGFGRGRGGGGRGGGGRGGGRFGGGGRGSPGGRGGRGGGGRYGPPCLLCSTLTATLHIHVTNFCFFAEDEEEDVAVEEEAVEEAEVAVAEA